MGQQESRAAFDNLLTKSHVGHALIHHGDQHNDIPTLLATILFLNGTPAQLEVACEHRKGQMQPWSMSPGRITSVEDRERFLGDVRFQRAFMDYFSLENVRLGGNPKTLAQSHLLSGPKPLIYGLFSGFGQPLLLLGDAMELQSAILLVESLVLAAVDWTDPLYDVVTHPVLDTPSSQPLLPPRTIISRVATDGRLSGVMRGTLGFRHVSHVLSNAAARTAIVEYVHCLDATDVLALVGQLGELSVLLLCASHKPGRPAFDFYLGHVPAFVHALRILLREFEDEHDRLVLVRGVWALVLLTYVTQLRPVLDPSLLPQAKGLPGASEAGSEGSDSSWQDVFEEFHGRPDTLKGKYLDTQFLRAMRSLCELGRASQDDGILYLRAACKLRNEWQSWIGLRWEKEETLNIRL